MNDQGRFDGAVVTTDHLIMLFRCRTAELTEDFLDKVGNILHEFGRLGFRSCA